MPATTQYDVIEVDQFKYQNALVYPAMSGSTAATESGGGGGSGRSEFRIEDLGDLIAAGRQVRFGFVIRGKLLKNSEGKQFESTTG